jgi:hypothetical protein
VTRSRARLSRSEGAGTTPDQFDDSASVRVPFNGTPRRTYKERLMIPDDDTPSDGWMISSSPSARQFLKAPAHVQADICKRGLEVWNGIKRYEGAECGWHGWFHDPLHIDPNAPIADEDLVPPVSWSDASKAVWPRLGRALKADIVRFEKGASEYFRVAAARGPRPTRQQQLEQQLQYWTAVMQSPAAQRH